MDDVILWEGPPCFTEQISITIKTLGETYKMGNKCWFNLCHSRNKKKNKAIKSKLTTLCLKHHQRQSSVFSSEVLLLYKNLLPHYYAAACSTVQFVMKGHCFPSSCKFSLTLKEAFINSWGNRQRENPALCLLLTDKCGINILGIKCSKTKIWKVINLFISYCIYFIIHYYFP